MDLLLFHKDIVMSIPHLFILIICHEFFNVMLRGMHYISNASSIILFNILCAFGVIKTM